MSPNNFDSESKSGNFKPNPILKFRNAEIYFQNKLTIPLIVHPNVLN